MNPSSRRGLIGGLVAGFFLGGVGGRISLTGEGRSLEELADLYLERSGFWHSLDHAVERESKGLTAQVDQEAFKNQALQKLKQKYIAHFTSLMNRSDFVRLLDMNEDRSNQKFNQACLQMNAEAKNLISGVFSEVRLSAEFQQKT